MGYRRTKRHGKPCRVFIEILEVVWLLKVGIEAKHKSNITELRGCVKKTWMEIDVQEYVNKLREEWN